MTPFPPVSFGQACFGFPTAFCREQPLQAPAECFSRKSDACLHAAHHMPFVCSGPASPAVGREEPHLTFTLDEKAAPGNRKTRAAASQLCVLLSRPAWVALLQIAQLTAGGVQPL